MCLISGTTSKLNAVFGESGSLQTPCHKCLEEVTPNVPDSEVCESSKLVSRKAGFDNVHASGPFRVYEGSCFAGFVAKATQGLRYSHQHILLVIA